MSDSGPRWRKFSPLDRSSPIYELVEGEDVVLDVTRNGEGHLEIAFHEGAPGRVYDLDSIERLLAEAKRLLEDNGEGGWRGQRVCRGGAKDVAGSRTKRAPGDAWVGRKR